MLSFSSSISSGLEIWSVNQISMYDNSKNIKLLGEISNNLPNDLFGINIYKTLESRL